MLFRGYHALGISAGEWIYIEYKLLFWKWSNMTKCAIILGASGSVGQALLAEIVCTDRFSRVIVLSRRPLGLNLGDRVEEKLVPHMDPPSLTQAVVDALAKQDADVVGFSVLGVGANTAKMTLEEHRAIDVELNAAFARGLKQSGKVHHLAFMSAIGANIRAKTTGSGAAGLARYSRVKGEAEAAVMSQGPEVVSIFRPSVIVGSRHTPKILAAMFVVLSPLILARFRPIKTTEIALAMIATALTTPGASAVYTYKEMKALFAKV